MATRGPRQQRPARGQYARARENYVHGLPLSVIAPFFGQRNEI